MIKRTIEDKVLDYLKPQKAVLIFGARRVGKTMLINRIAEGFDGNVSSLNAEDFNVQQMLAQRTVANYNMLFSKTDLLIIDEAQNILEIGKAIKLIVDNIEGIKVLASGSSSFDLQNKTGEPLVGRASEFNLYPFSQIEFSSTETGVETFQRLEQRLIYGSYPELSAINNFDDKQNYLHEIANAYLLKDILALDGIKNSAKMRDLLRLVALQVGSEVSYDELGRQLSLSRNTVEKYLDLLSKVFVVYKLPAYSRNLRKEISKSSKWYFYDNGIRNAVIGNFQPLAVRLDVGQLWENYLISERIKRSSNARARCNYYFWRIYNGSEVDLIEEHDGGKIKAFEFKWGDKKVKLPASFQSAYPEAECAVINRNNYLEFIL